MKKLRIETLQGMRDQLAAYHWDDTEITELVNPQLGIITGFQDLLVQLDILRQVDLNDVPPCAEIKSPK